MPTPMSPVPPPDPDAEAPSPPVALAETLAPLAAGPIRATDVARLSDLSREAAVEFEAAWPGLPDEARVAVVRQMDDLAEERIELQFGRALRVALADVSPVVRQLAVAALWEDDGADLVDRLLDLEASDPSEDVRAAAADVLGRVAERAVAGGVDEQTGRRVRTALAELAGDETAAYGPRRRALESVGVFADDDVRGLIRAAYEAGDQGLQASALRAMGRSHDPRWRELVLDELRSPEAELRYEAARASGTLGDDRAVPELSELAQDEDAEVRFAAIAALGQIGGRAALRVLRALTEEADDAEAELIAEAIEEAAGELEPLRVGG